MEENNKQQNQKTNAEMDRFSQFFFGKSSHRESDKKAENDSQVLSEQKEQTSYDDRYNRNNDWFFGVKRKEDTPSPQTDQNHIETILNNVDFELLMETIDMLVTTTQPLIKEITPFFHRFIKKFKSD
ncbi:hypothetical protein CYL18_03550 [Pradoshia eiseniae]|uniref:Uncharacterized protein n=1 Tax=Pradoshia eiseniae TaxID=2064768 RepID=A0A2S7N4L5_9BACI|nr:hypothetical protein [Pradoshia eiseniae]PQD96966.1 hypothetical protein CYL18_03550 [Pradoshia eiseniae]